MSPKTEKKCNLKCFCKNDGHHEEKVDNCNRLESFICSNVNCNVRICKKCYRSFSTEDITTIIPNAVSQDDDSLNEVNESENDSDD